MSSKLAGVHIAVLGGDDRELVLVPRLLQLGAKVKVAGISVLAGNNDIDCFDKIEDAVRNAHFIVLPMPGIDEKGIIKAKYGIETLQLNNNTMAAFPENSVVIVGVARPLLKTLVAEKGLKLIEIAEMDEVAILNSVPSAEGAIQMAMEQTNITIHGSKVFVLGFGRCGLTLARMVSAMGAKTTVVARKPADLARIMEMGMKPLTYGQLEEYISEADIIFNTVPGMVLDKILLEKANPEVYICDIASAPGGIDFNAARNLGIKAELAPGLPGKVAPKTAGLILAKVIPDIIINEIANMKLKDVKIGFAITGSHCTIKEVLKQVSLLVLEGAEVYPIISSTVDVYDTRFGKAAEWKEFLKKTTNNDIISTIVDAEPIGPNNLYDIMAVAPCTGNTLAKLANGITDSPVLMGIKAHLRNQKPVVLSISTNDGLGINAKNIGLLLNMKNIYLVPFGQDNPIVKANSLVAKVDLLTETIVQAMAGKQLQPVMIQY
jgi:dipicolinate synthase subunit A